MSKLGTKISQWWYRVRASKANETFGRVSEPLSTWLVRTSAAVVGIWAATEAWQAHTAIKKKAAVLAASDLATWGQYGDYLGGVIGTYATIASVCLLVVTFHAQYLALEHAKKQSVREELQRVIASTVKTLDELMDSELRPESPFLKIGAWTTEVQGRLLLTGLARFWIALSDGHLKRAHCDAIKADIQTLQLWRHLCRLEWCLGQFIAHGGSPVFIAFYGAHYGPAAAMAYVVFKHDFPASAIRNLGLQDRLQEWDQLVANIKQ